MKHTPGPWTYSAGDGWKSVSTSKEFLLHNGRIFFPHNPADWRLIAAAPDLYAEVKRFREVLVSIRQDTTAVDALIKKVEGA